MHVLEVYLVLTKIIVCLLSVSTVVWLFSGRRSNTICIDYLFSLSSFVSVVLIFRGYTCKESKCS